MESLASQKGQVALPDSIKYPRLPPKSIAGTSHLRKFASSNGTAFDPSNNSIIRIPVTASGINTFLDGHNGFLEFKISNDNSTAASPSELQSIDGGIFSICSRIRLIDRTSGAIIQDTSNYNLLHNTLWKYTTDEGGMKISNATSGTAGNLKGSGNDPSADNYHTTYDSTEGKYFPAVGSTYDMVLTTPIVSGFLNNTKNLAIPLGASGGFEIEITLAPSNECMVATTTTAYNIKSCSYYAPVFQVLGEGFQSSMSQMMSAMGGLSFVGDAWHNFVGSTDDSLGEKVINVPIQCRSLKSLFSVSRTTTAVSSVTASGLNTTLPNACTEFSYMIGNERFPPSRITTKIDTNATDTANTGTAFQSVMMALGQGNSLHARCLVGDKDFNDDQFVCAVDCEKYQNQSGVVASTGVNTLEGNLNVSLEINNNPAAAQRVDSFALCEVMYHLSPSGAFSVSR